VSRRCLNGGRKSGSAQVDFRGGAHDPKGGQAVLVFKEEFEGREAGLDGQDVRGGAGEAVRGPPLDLVPEGRELPCYVNRGSEGIRPVAEDGKEERGGQTMAQEGQEAHPPGGEPFDSHEGSLGLGQSLGEVRNHGDRGGEPVAQPADLILERENHTI